MPAETTPALGLPLLHAAQAQKEVTHNEALAILDIIAASVVEGSPLNTPPVDPDPGRAWIIGNTPTGAWSGQAHKLVLMTEGGWRFIDPPVGFTLYRANGLAVRRTETAWIEGELVTDTIVIAGDVVLAARQPDISSPSGGAVIDSQARDTLDSILDAMRSHGLIG